MKKKAVFLSLIILILLMVIIIKFSNYSIYFYFIIPTICFLISLFIWYKYGEEDTIVETVEFYPPDNLNSLEIGYLYKGYAENKDVVSLLIYLADKGYIKINEIGDKNFQIIKLKEYDGNNEIEKDFLDKLFSIHAESFSYTFLNPIKDILNDIKKINNIQESSVSSKSKPCNYVNSSDLHDKFYVVVNEILNTIEKENKDKVFKKDNYGFLAILVMMILTMYTVWVLPVLTYADLDSVTEFIPLLLMLLLIIVYFKSYLDRKETTKYKNICWITIVAMGIFGVIALSLIIANRNMLYLFGFVIGISSIISMLVWLKSMKKRTEYGCTMYGKIKGFKNFIETAEKQKLEALVSTNPTYFYDILPFAYVLGVSNKWIKKFETISIQEPTWYNSEHNFDMTSFINTTMKSAERVLSSSPLDYSNDSGGSYSSGGYSGGGFSGGGSGGGGGSSW